MTYAEINLMKEMVESISIITANLNDDVVEPIHFRVSKWMLVREALKRVIAEEEAARRVIGHESANNDVTVRAKDAPIVVNSPNVTIHVHTKD